MERFRYPEDDDREWAAERGWPPRDMRLRYGDEDDWSRSEWGSRRREREPWGRDDEGWPSQRYGYERPGMQRGYYGGERAGGGYGRPMSGQGAIGYRGLGPKGYQRPEERVREDVCERLTDHPGVDARAIEVEVRDGVVYLRGTVEDRAQKRAAEEAVEQTTGIRDIRNELETRKGMWETLKEAVSGATDDDEDERLTKAASRTGGEARRTRAR